jgi:hypothetical protein
VRTAPIVMRDPLLKSAPEVTLVQRNHPVQAFAPNCANHSFAERVGMSGRLHRLRAVRPKPFESRIPFIRYIGLHRSECTASG